MRAELKNTACSRLGNMLHLEIQKGKEAMEIPEFQQEIRRNASCMNIPIMKKWRVKLFSNGIYFSDIWFSVVKISEEAIAEGVDYCGQVKTSHKGFCLATLEKLTKEWPGGFILL